MNPSRTGMRIFEYYRKRILSFRSHLSRAERFNDFKEIHLCRVDLKKLFALFQLFELLDKKKIRSTGFSEFFKGVFISLGAIREIQLNKQYILHCGIRSGETDMLITYLNERENKAIQNFHRESEKIRKKARTMDHRVIRKICEAVDYNEIKIKSRRFIWEKGLKIKKLSAAGHDPSQLHKIRKHLKSAGSIVSLRKTALHIQDPPELFHGIRRVEVLIGQWHDKLLLEADLKKYTTRIYHEDYLFPGSFNEIVSIIRKDVVDFEEAIWKEMDNVIYNILLL